MGCVVTTLPPLFARALPGFAALPAVIRAVHAPGRRLALVGRAEVERAPGLAAAAIGALFRLPEAGRNVAVRVVIETRNDRELWTRDFAGRRFSSVMSAGRGGAGHLRERFGPFSFDLAVDTDPGGLAIRVTAWSLGPLRLPARFRPATDAREFVDEEGRFCFDVSLYADGFGRFVRYRGWLVPEHAP